MKHYITLIFNIACSTDTWGLYLNSSFILNLCRIRSWLHVVIESLVYFLLWWHHMDSSSTGRTFVDSNWIIFLRLNHVQFIVTRLVCLLCVDRVCFTLPPHLKRLMSRVWTQRNGPKGEERRSWNGEIMEAREERGNVLFNFNLHRN